MVFHLQLIELFFFVIYRAYSSNMPEYRCVNSIWTISSSKSFFTRFVHFRRIDILISFIDWKNQIWKKLMHFISIFLYLHFHYCVRSYFLFPFVCTIHYWISVYLTTHVTSLCMLMSLLFVSLKANFIEFGFHSLLLSSSAYFDRVFRLLLFSCSRHFHNMFIIFLQLHCTVSCIIRFSFTGIKTIYWFDYYYYYYY